VGTAGRRSKILGVIALDAGEAADFLARGSGAATGPTGSGRSALKGSTATALAVEGENAPSPRWLKIQVCDREESRPRVSVDVPLSFLQFGLQVGRDVVPGLEGIDWKALGEALDQGEVGLLVDVHEEEDCEQVQIFIE